MTIIGDVLIPAYGDYGVNTGPIHVYELDLTTLELTDVLTMHTEETWRLRKLSDGRLAVPYIDPQGYQDPTQGVAAIRAADGSWSTVTNVVDHPPIHCPAFLRRASGMLVLAGSSLEFPSGVAAAWVSTDNGGSWSWEQVSTGSTQFERIYAVAEAGGVLSAWVSNGSSPSGGRYERDDSNGTWTQVDQAAQVEETYHTTTLGHSYVWTLAQNQSSGYVGVGTACAPFPALADLPDDLAAALAAWPTHALDITPAADGSIWFLTREATVNRVWRGNADGTVSDVGTVDAVTRSIAAHTDGHVYFGTADSRIVRAEIPT